MSSNSNMANSQQPVRPWVSLHLIEHFREGILQLQGLPDFIGAHVRIFPVFEKAGTLMFTKELDDRRHVRFPVLWPAFEVCKNRSDAGLVEELDRILDVLIKVGVEDALIHEVQS